MDQISALFQGWDSAMVRACLQGTMGCVLPWGRESALACLGDFCFLAGRPVRELLERADRPILVPGNSGWDGLIAQTLGERAAPFTRYALRHEPEQFDRDKLNCFITSLPQGFILTSICEADYPALMAQDWSRDLCGNFANGADFAGRGIGTVVLWEGRPVAGAASYAVCEGEIEIEIDTAPQFRRRGLAAVCGARLILNCLDRGLYPCWDAHDRRSLALAEKLGYRLLRPYTAYWVEKK